MKKTVLLTLAGNFLYSFIFSQIPLPHRKEDYKINNFNKRIVEIKQWKEHIILQNINSIEIIDARPDTMAIGLAQEYTHKPFFVVLEKGLSYDASQFLDNSVNLIKPDSFSVVMVIKKFWLTSGLDEQMEQKIRNSDVDSSKERISSLLARIEFYLRKGSDYYILYRFDTTIIKNLFVSKDASALIGEAFFLSFSKLIDMDSRLQSISVNKRKFSWNEIEIHNQKRFDIPILKDSMFTRGVYFTFEEFKNNNPGQRDFEINKDKLTDLIFIKQSNGKLEPVRDTWGYCDGKNLYIRSTENYFLLQREGNAFYIYGSKAFKHKSVAYVPGLGIAANATSGGPTQYTNPAETTSEHLTLKLRPFELDWDDGELN